MAEIEYGREQGGIQDVAFPRARLSGLTHTMRLVSWGLASGEVIVRQ